MFISRGLAHSKTMLKMFVILCIFLLTTNRTTNSNQIQQILVMLLNDNSGAPTDSKLDSVPLLPSYFINDEDIPSDITNKQSKGIVCLDRINFTKNGMFKKFLTFEIEDYTHKYLLNKEIETCDDKACITTPKSADEKCPLDDVFESIKIVDFNDNFLLFSRYCYLSEFGVVTHKGGIIFQKENHQLSKKDYNLMLDYFGISKNLNVTDLNFHKIILSKCADHCNEFFEDLTQYCKYVPYYDNSNEIWIFIGVASIINYILYIIVSVFYYYF